MSVPLDAKAVALTRGVTIKQSGFVPVVSQVPAHVWRCEVCGWLGTGHLSETSALSEASEHMWTEHDIALCAPVDGEKQYGHPGHRWQHVKGSDSTDQCARCKEYSGK